MRALVLILLTVLPVFGSPKEILLKGQKVAICLDAEGASYNSVRLPPDLPLRDRLIKRLQKMGYTEAKVCTADPSMAKISYFLSAVPVGGVPNRDSDGRTTATIGGSHGLFCTVSLHLVQPDGIDATLATVNSFDDLESIVEKLAKQLHQAINVINKKHE